MKQAVLLILIAFLSTVLFTTRADAQTYVGSDSCITCHNTVDANLGYNIYEEYIKTGHPYKLNPVNGAPPVYPPNTSPGVTQTPPGTTWDDFAFVIGGYGWKARFVQKNGMIFTADSSAQYNFETQSWVPYHYGETKYYNEGCFKCHTTGATPEGSWNGIPADSLGTFSEPGIRCEGCHGPGSDHVADPTGVHPPNSGTALTWDVCASCHNRGGVSNSIPASGGYIKHHEQSNEMLASRHGQLNFTCGTCHDAHIALRYPDVAGEGLTAITTTCETCHPGKEVMLNGSPKPISCVDCHMAPASKSAVGMQVGNGWRGDIKTHIFKINTDPVTKDSMFSADGKLVNLDDNGLAAVTLDFACLRCHTDENVEWASTYAKDIHVNGIVGIADTKPLPEKFFVSQNYPNPFNPTTAIEFALPKTSNVTVEIYSLTGELIGKVLEDKLPAGKHRVIFDASNLTSGVYFYKVTADENTQVKKMTLLR